jgi:hypothetical protein
MKGKDNQKKQYCVDGEIAVIGDPLTGRAKYSCAGFAKKWHYTGIVLGRRPPFR